MKRFILFILLFIPVLVFGQGQDIFGRYVVITSLKNIMPHAASKAQVFVNRQTGFLYANDTVPGGGGSAADSVYQYLTTDTIAGNGDTAKVVMITGFRIPYLANHKTKVATFDSTGAIDTAQTQSLTTFFSTNQLPEINVDSLNNVKTINAVDTGQILCVDGATGKVGGKTTTNIENYVFQSVTVGDTLSYRAGVDIDTINGILLRNGATVWDDIVANAFQLKSIGQADKPDFNTSTLTLDFPMNDTTEQGGYNYQLRHTYKEGSDIEFHLHVEQDTTGTPVFAIQYQWVNINGSIPTTWTKLSSTGFVYSRASGEKKQNIIEFPAISGTGKTISSILSIRLYRTDNSYVGGCRVKQADVHFEINSLGSKTELSK